MFSNWPVIPAEEIITQQKVWEYFMKKYPKEKVSYIKMDALRNKTNMSSYNLGRTIYWDINKLSSVCFAGLSDYPFTKEMYDDHPEVKLWIVTGNTLPPKEYPNVISLPLGITNDCNDTNLHPIYSNTKHFDIARQYCTKSNNLAYMNFSISTCLQYREKVWQQFSRLDWVTTEMPYPSHQGRINFLAKIGSHPFTIAPRGNAVESHRMWEALYMKSIPITAYDECIYHQMTDLPILFITDDWSVVTKDFLVEKYKEMSNIDYNFSKLKVSWWIRHIEKKIKSIYTN